MSAFFDTIYSLILWINRNVFVHLNENTIRIDAFIGITSILIAIVIFVAETMKDSKLETQKRFILEKTNMKKTGLYPLFILTFYFFKELIIYNCKSDFITNIVYFFVELLILILILRSIYLTIRIFCISIKLNTNSDYFFDEYNKYIKRRLNIIQKKYSKHSSKKNHHESINELVKKNDIYFTLDLEKKDEYIPIKATRSGIFKYYSCRSLQSLIDKIENNNSKKDKFVPQSDPMFILNLRGGEKINRGITIAYCKDENNDYNDSIRNSLVFDENLSYQDGEINLILDDLYSLASVNIDKKEFDNDRRLYNFYEYLYENNMYDSLNISIEFIRSIFNEYANDLNKNIELAKFLSSLATMAYYKEDFEHYRFLCNYTYYCYRIQLDLTKDYRKVAFDFSNNVFRNNYFSIKENSDNIYYDVLLSVFMNFLFDLLLKKDYTAINDLFHNIIFDYNGYISEEPTSYDIVKMQFSFGFIYGLIVLSNKKILCNDDKIELKKLINNINNSFVDIYDDVSALKYFKKYYHKRSNIQSMYNEYNFVFEDTEYRNSWSVSSIDEIEVLKQYIYVFNINYSISNINDEELVSKDNKYYFEKLLKSVQSNNKSDLETILDINYNKETLIKLLDDLINKCKEKEEEYNRKNSLDKKRIKSFLDLIEEEFYKGNNLINYLKKQKKYCISNLKSKKLFGFNQLIGRNIFFKEVYGIDNLSRYYGREINIGITKKYINKLDNISRVVNKDFNKYIKQVKNVEEYCVITGLLNWKKLNLDKYDSNLLKVGTKEIDLISIPNVNDIYLIKKNDLPIINMMSIDLDEKNESKKTELFYHFIDCSKNEKVVRELLKNNKITSKNDEKEQINYLKRNCIIKLFVSPSIKHIANTKCLKFVVNDEIK